MDKSVVRMVQFSGTPLSQNSSMDSYRSNYEKYEMNDMKNEMVITLLIK